MFGKLTIQPRILWITVACVAVAAGMSPSATTPASAAPTVAVAQTTAMVQSLFNNPVNGEVRLPQGKLTVAPTLRLPRGLKIIGNKTVFALAAGSGDYYSMLMGTLPSTDLSGLSISGVTFDQSAALNPVTVYSLYHGSPRFAVAVFRGTGISITGSTFLGADNLNTVLVGSVATRITISNNTFQTIDPALHDHSSIYTHSNDVTITGNTFTGSNIYGAAIETHGDRATVTGNKIQGYYRATNLTSNDTLFAGNTVTDGVNIADLWSLGGLSNVVVRDNVMTRSNWTAWVQILHHSIPAEFRQLVIYDPTTPTGFRNITITNNTTTK